MKERFAELIPFFHLEHIIDLRKTAENIPEEIGTAMMHSELEDCHQYGCYLEFQSKQQGNLNGVTKVCYLPSFLYHLLRVLTLSDYVRSTIRA